MANSYNFGSHAPFADAFNDNYDGLDPYCDYGQPRQQTTYPSRFSMIANQQPTEPHHFISDPLDYNGYRARMRNQPSVPTANQRGLDSVRSSQLTSARMNNMPQSNILPTDTRASVDGSFVEFIHMNASLRREIDNKFNQTLRMFDETKKFYQDTNNACEEIRKACEETKSDIAKLQARNNETIAELGKFAGKTTDWLKDLKRWLMPVVTFCETQNQPTNQVRQGSGGANGAAPGGVSGGVPGGEPALYENFTF